MESAPRSAWRSSRAICAEDGVYYQIEDSRSAEAASSVLGDFAGKLLVDGYGVYGALKKRGGRFEIAHCWAHTRRKFVEVEELHQGHCTEVLDMIGELYEVERVARDGPEPLLFDRRRKPDLQQNSPIQIKRAFGL